MTVLSHPEDQSPNRISQGTGTQALIESAELFRLVADTAPVMVWMSDTSKLCTYFNKPWLDFTGKSMDSEVGNGWAQSVHPDDLQRCLDTYIQAFDQRQQFRMEHRLRRHDGVYRWVFDVGVPLYNKDGSFAGYIGSCIDVTEQKVAEAALRKSEERFRLATQAGKMFAYEWDAATDVIVRSGDCSHILGIDESATLTGQEVVAKAHPDDREKLTNALALLNPQNPNLKIVYRMVHPSRGVIWVERNSRAVFDAEGKILRVTGMVADITERKLAEGQLAVVTERLQLAMESGKSVGWDWDVKSGKDTWFGDLQTMFGIPAKVRTGQIEDFRSYVHPEDRSLVWKAVNNAMQTHAPYAAEFRILWPNGTVRWVAAKGKFYYSPDGETERMVGMSVDITERKATEEALRRKEVELTEAQRLAGVGSWQWDPETDTVVWSEELYRIAARDPRLPAVSYKDHPRIYTAESWERLRLAVEEALRTGKPYQLDLEMVRPDGSTRWLTARGEARIDGKGRVTQLRGTVHDITERKRSEEALREGEERLRLAAQSGHMYAYEWDAASDIVVRSAEFSDVLGIIDQPARTTRKQILTKVHPDDQQKFIAAISDRTPEDPTCKVRYRMLGPDGQEIWLEKTGRAFFDHKGKLLRMIGMIADITDRKLAEDALSSVSSRLIEAQETERVRIARELHDDIGQRLALLTVRLQQLKQSSPEAGQDLRRNIDELNQHVAELSADVAAMSHELHSSKLRVLGLVAAMRGFCNELAVQQGVEIDFSHDDISPTVSAEISLCLFRVLQEALHNAVKHSGVRRFEVELRETPDAIVLSVHDAGRGFDAESAITGRGLGLTSMQERMKLVNGDLSVDSQAKHGTTILARVPLKAEIESVRAAG
jgi:PAS domain S-box-containing protein